MGKKINERIGDTILQNGKEVTVCGKTYTVAPPSCATLIEVSKRIPEVPYVELMGDMNQEVLAMAKDSRPLFEQVAVLILGAKALRDDNPPLKGIFRRRRKTRLASLTDDLMYELSPKEANKLRGELLSMMEVQDFFEFAASLQEVSLIQRTRGAEMTAFGL
jgi:hypothetical protein